MTRETFVIILKALFTSVGSFLIGSNLLGQEVDTNFLETLLGVILSGVSIFWSIQDKELTIEKGQAFLRQIGLFIGGFLIAWGKITAEQLEMILGGIVIIIPALQSWLSKKKAQRLQENSIQPSELKAIPTKAEQKRRAAKRQ